MEDRKNVAKNVDTTFKMQGKHSGRTTNYLTAAVRWSCKEILKKKELPQLASFRA